MPPCVDGGLMGSWGAGVAEEEDEQWTMDSDVEDEDDARPPVGQRSVAASPGQVGPSFSIYGSGLIQTTTVTRTYTPINASLLISRMQLHTELWNRR